MMVMKTYARIQNEVVAELLTTDLDIAGCFNPTLIWVDVSAVSGIAPGWQQDPSGFSPPAATAAPPEPPSLAQLQAAIAAISAQLAALTPTS